MDIIEFDDDYRIKALKRRHKNLKHIVIVWTVALFFATLSALLGNKIMIFNMTLDSVVIALNIHMMKVCQSEILDIQRHTKKHI